jgi:hypothetical protein
VVRAVRGPVLVVFWLLVLTGAVVWQWGPGLGDGPAEVCLSRPTPDGVGMDLNWAPEAEQSWWPFGVTCHWTNAATGEPGVEDGPGWGPTVVALLALAGLGSVVLGVRRRGPTR